jgi:hypothetical protein
MVTFAAACARGSAGQSTQCTAYYSADIAASEARVSVFFVAFTATCVVVAFVT